VIVTNKKSKEGFMKLTPAQRQHNRRKKLKSKNFYLVQVWVPKEKIVEIKAIAASMGEGWKEELKPTHEQLTLAQFLCNTKKRLKLSQNILASSSELTKWIDENNVVEEGRVNS
jgi:hypothetical protein